MKNFKKLIKEAYLGNPLNEGIEGTPQYYVKYTTQDGETAKSGFMSKKEAIKKEEALVNSGVKKSAVYRIQKHVDLNGKPYTIDTELDKEIDYRKDEKGRPINEIESGDVVVYNHDDHTVQRIEDDELGVRIYIRPNERSYYGGRKDTFWVKPTDIETKEEFLDRMMRDQIQHDEETLRRERGLEEESNDEKMERDQAIQSYKRLTDDDELKLKQIKAMLDKERGLEETAGTFGDGVTKETKKKYAEKTKELYKKAEVKSDDFNQLGIEDKQKVIAAVTGPKLKDILSKSSSRVDEIDMNDPVLIKTRASQMKRDKIEADEKDKKSYLDTKYGPTFMDKLEAEIDLKNELKNLEKEREDVLMRIEDIGFETEETAEPEGGEKADDLADRLMAAEKELRAINNKIIDVKDELGYFRMYENEDEEFKYKAPKDTDGDDITIDPDTEFKVDLKHLIQKHKIEDVNEGTCGYTPDGKPRSKPAGPELMEDDINLNIDDKGKESKALDNEVNHMFEEDLAENILKKIFGPKLDADVVTILAQEISDIIKDKPNIKDKPEEIAKELAKGSNINPKDLLKSRMGFIGEESDTTNESKEFNFNKMIKEALTPNYLK